MRFSLKPDFEKSAERYEAFWEREIIDRIPVSGFRFPLKKQREIIEKDYRDFTEMWLDIDTRVENFDIEMNNYEYLADTLPVVFPNMGPEIFSAWCGCGYEFGESTAWSTPCIKDWESDAENVGLDMDHPLFKATERLTRELLKKAKGKFIIGLTDFHPGGDHLAALRDPQNLAIDLLENPEYVKKEIKKSCGDFYKAYDHFYDILKEADMPISTWTPLINDKKYYVPSNDFSCMISTDMFEEFFLEGLIEECRFYDRSIYHLDGPGALRHLDILLEIKELDAVQYSPGFGNFGFSKWIEVYKKIQKANKAMQIVELHVDDLDLLFENLEPEGIWISSIIDCDKENMEHILKRITNWE